ncbi:hypothetical protein EK599_06835 [Vibrio sp. T187]|uniref:hypothetical protein n=1 Tax=Vibrio TaxID=662 RepID=UPI0010C9CF72|nr:MULTISPECIES: hypothetical protein [Vibrio]MBW3695403.1 hypothetical protein [Vibrio sp. T187]
MHFANCENESLSSEIENKFEIAYPCIEHILTSEKAPLEIRLIQNRLLTYKELLLHESILDKGELKKAHSVLRQPEKKLAKQGIKALAQAISEIDVLLEHYQAKLPIKSS